MESLTRAFYLTRDLITTPAEDMGPQHMIAEAKALVEAHLPLANIHVVEGEELLAQVRSVKACEEAMARCLLP